MDEDRSTGGADVGRREGAEGIGAGTVATLWMPDEGRPSAFNEAPQPKQNRYLPSLPRPQRGQVTMPMAPLT